MNQTNLELDAATASHAFDAISRGFEAIERQIESIDQSIYALSKKRKACLIQMAEGLLPAISGRVLTSLSKVVPEFVTPTVRHCFDSNRKFLGIFAGPGYVSALALLQTRLSSHLDQAKYGELESIDAKISILSLEKVKLCTRSKEAVEFLKEMGVERPKNVSRTVEGGEQVRRALSVWHKNVVSRSSVTSQFAGTSMSVSSNDDFDLWFYFMTETPISVRTLLFSAIFGDHQNKASHDQGTVGIADAVPSDWPQSMGAKVHAAHVDASVESCAIATDDRLGAFS